MNSTISTQFVDSIPPKISVVRINPVQATRTNTFELTVSDNLGIANISGIITRQVENETPNGTVTETEKFTRSFRQSKSDNNLYKLDFNETDTLGVHNVKINVTDEAGNTVSREETFQVVTLNSVSVVNSDFVFDPINPGQTADREVIEINRADVPVEVTLNDFRHDVAESGISIGLKSSKAANPKFFDLNQTNPSVSITEKGVYSLIVDSSVERDDFRGKLNITVLPDTPKLADQVSRVRFSGEVWGDLPAPQEYTLEEFSGRVDVVNSSVVPERFRSGDFSTMIRYTGFIPAERCSGYVKWAECLTDFSLDEADRVESEAEQARGKAGAWKWRGITAVVASGLFAVMYKRKKDLEGKLTGFVRVDEESLKEYRKMDAEVEDYV